MKIRGKIHCFFEQSGTFRDEFRKLGYEAEDYDIGNEFGKTDHLIDLFGEIVYGYDGEPSVFDNIGKDDLIMAFFPCIYFSAVQIPLFMLKSTMRDKQKELDYAIARTKRRAEYHVLLYKLYGICLQRGLRLIIENPFNTIPSYLAFPGNFPPPTLIDNDRTVRGDKFHKPTGYWFVGCEPTRGLLSRQQLKAKDIGRIQNTPSAKVAGTCSMARSMISHDYARNFICDFILGKRQEYTEMTLF